MSETKAIARGLKIPPRKIGLVASLIRGRNVSDSLTILEHVNQTSASYLVSLLKSALANAQKSEAEADLDAVFIAALNVSPGPTTKRFRPAARGMVRPRHYRTSHVTVILKSSDSVQKPGERGES